MDVKNGGQDGGKDQMSEGKSGWMEGGKGRIARWMKGRRDGGRERWWEGCDGGNRKTLISRLIKWKGKTRREKVEEDKEKTLLKK